MGQNVKIRYSQVKDNPFIITYTGKKFYPFSPKAKDINIIDIAHSLSLINRFNGHTKFPYTVSQHCCYAYDLASNVNKKAALLHDGSEAYICDIASPIKYYIDNYQKIEDIIQIAISMKFDFEYPLEHEIKTIDMKLLHTEFRDLTHLNYDKSLVYNFQIKEWGWKKAKKEFLKRFNKVIL